MYAIEFKSIFMSKLYIHEISGRRIKTHCHRCSCGGSSRLILPNGESCRELLIKYPTIHYHFHRLWSVLRFLIMILFWYEDISSLCSTWSYSIEDSQCIHKWVHYENCHPGKHKDQKSQKMFHRICMCESMDLRQKLLVILWATAGTEIALW